MVKVISNRIYLECEDAEIDSYMNEMDKVIRLRLDKHVIIWDQSGLEENNTDGGIFDIYLSMNKLNGCGMKIFDRRIWINLVKINLYRTKFLQVGCWKSQLSLIDEIKSVCEILSIEECGEQIEFFVELSDPVREYVINRYLDSSGNIKWFNFGLYNSSEKKSGIFTSGHFGEENYIFMLNAEEVEKVIATVENNDVYIRINRHQL